MWLISSLFLALQVALPDFQFFDVFPFSEKGFVPPEGNIGECDVV